MSPSEVELATSPEAAAPAPAMPPAARGPGYGQLIPAFKVASDANPNFQSRSLGGQWMVLMFFGSLGLPACKAAHDRIVARRSLFDDSKAQFFGVGIDPADRTQRGVKNSLPGLRYFWDFDLRVCNAFGAASPDGVTPIVYLIDRALRVADIEPIDRLDALLDRLEAHLAAERAAPPEFGAPVLTIPRILEPDLCDALIEHYNHVGGESSGFVREVNGVTVPMLDDGTKRRRDVTIQDEDLRHRLCFAISMRLIPLIEQAFNWRATRIERYIVACYSADDQGFFRVHRDNTTPATIHRKFAVSINLNDDFDGGDLRFPEFGQRTYRPPVGGATVFGTALLHEATPVSRGVRYATLPFLYDEEGRRLRDANMASLVTGPPVRVG